MPISVCLLGRCISVLLCIGVWPSAAVMYIMLLVCARRIQAVVYVHAWYKYLRQYWVGMLAGVSPYHFTRCANAFHVRLASSSTAGPWLLCASSNMPHPVTLSMHTLTGAQPHRGTPSHIFPALIYASGNLTCSLRRVLCHGAIVVRAGHETTILAGVQSVTQRVIGRPSLQRGNSSQFIICYRDIKV